jgi:hypothetical protein
VGGTRPPEVQRALPPRGGRTARRSSRAVLNEPQAGAETRAGLAVALGTELLADRTGSRCPPPLGTPATGERALPFSTGSWRRPRRAPRWISGHSGPSSTRSAPRSSAASDARSSLRRSDSFSVAVAALSSSCVVFGSTAAQLNRASAQAIAATRSPRRVIRAGGSNGSTGVPSQRIRSVAVLAGNHRGRCDRPVPVGVVSASSTVLSITSGASGASRDTDPLALTSRKPPNHQEGFLK